MDTTTIAVDIAKSVFQLAREIGIDKVAHFFV